MRHHKPINDISDIAWYLVVEIAGGRNNMLTVGIKYRIAQEEKMQQCIVHSSLHTTNSIRILVMLDGTWYV